MVLKLCGRLLALAALVFPLIAVAEVDEAKFNKAEGYPPHPTNAISLAEPYRVGTMTGKGVKAMQSADIWMSPASSDTVEFDNNFKLPFYIDPETTVRRNSILAMALIKNGKIVFQQFQYGANSESLFDSQSIAKTFTAMAIGVALEKGLLSSLDEPLSILVPELKSSVLGDISVRRALQMDCSVAFKFSVDFDGEAAKYLGLKFFRNPGFDNIFDYFSSLLSSGRTGVFNYDPHCSDALSLLIQKRSGKTLKTFFEEHLWTKIGAASKAAWLHTRIKPQFTSGANSFFATLNDYVRIANFLANECAYAGKQVINKEYCRKMREETIAVGSYPSQFKRYGYQTWVKHDAAGSWYAALGALGQRMYIDPVSKTAMMVFALEDRHIRETDVLWEWFRKQ